MATARTTLVSTGGSITLRMRESILSVARTSQICHIAPSDTISYGSVAVPGSAGMVNPRAAGGSCGILMGGQ